MHNVTDVVAAMDVDENTGTTDTDSTAAAQQLLCLRGVSSTDAMESFVASVVDIPERSFTVGQAWLWWVCGTNGGAPIRLRQHEIRVGPARSKNASAFHLVMRHIEQFLLQTGTLFPAMGEAPMAAATALALLSSPGLQTSLSSGCRKAREPLVHMSLRTAKAHLEQGGRRKCNAEPHGDSEAAEAQSEGAGLPPAAVAAPDTAARTPPPWTPPPYPGARATAALKRTPAVLGLSDHGISHAYAVPLAYLPDWEDQMRLVLWQLGRVLFVVPPDGNCAFHSIAMFSGIPSEVLRWFTAVRMALELSWLDPDQVLYYSLLEDGGIMTPVGDLVRGVLQPGRFEAEPVLTVACRAIALPAILLPCAPKSTPRVWFSKLRALHSHDRHGREVNWAMGTVNDGVRVIVHYGLGNHGHFSPALLQQPVVSRNIPECRTLQQAVEELCGQLLQLEGSIDDFQRPLPSWHDVTVRWCAFLHFVFLACACVCVCA